MFRFEKCVYIFVENYIEKFNVKIYYYGVKNTKAQNVSLEGMNAKKKSSLFGMESSPLLGSHSKDGLISVLASINLITLKYRFARSPLFHVIVI